MGEVKRHPYTSVSALLCLLALPAIYITKADASDVQAINTKFASLEKTFKRESTLGALERIEGELFEINLRISTLQREDQPVDSLLLKRRDDLLSQQRRLEAQLRTMDGQ